ncbi:hypothetical protein LJ739_05530 [Aestuariibacter halophilus]|uniref:Solute-binding protein family 3/N-terminal domain-containing protein n=1 Tax=Fluctibacter halophilus TaxID=226011 RepID=A0ABS8G6I7_9ALTE|nr:hypothetical protein [Aestuariibacter halophilus]MCC2615696.1 hypothetical protein [Aestuariibacter halophilus]
MLKSVLFLIGILSTAAVSADPMVEQMVVRIAGPQTENDPSFDYFSGLLTEVFRVTENDYRPVDLQVVPFPGQGRTVLELAQGRRFDVIWTAKSPLRDDTLKRISLPLMRNGLGWRGFVIRADRQEAFRQIHDLKSLSKLRACQGQHWPDADILEMAGLPVLRIESIDTMFAMVANSRCDYLPLSVFEGKGETNNARVTYPELRFFTDTLLAYSLSMHFFVHPQNTLLAQRIERGLMQLEAVGWIEEYMRNHRLTASAFPLEQFASSHVIEIGDVQALAF